MDDCCPDSLDDFGVDYDGPLPEEQLHTIDVPETVSPLPQTLVERFKSGVTVSIEEAVTEYTTKRNWLLAYLEREEGSMCS